MSTEFPHFYIALNWTLEYYSTYRIKDEIEYISGKGYGGANHTLVERTYDFVFTLQERMEAEMIYTIQNCYPPTQLIHLNLFKDWLGDFRISETNGYEVICEINNYNSTLYKKFLEETLKKEEEFKSSKNYQLKHGEEYESDSLVPTYLLATAAFMNGLGGFNSVNLRNRKAIVKNNKFFCLEKTPEYIDLEYFENYLERLHKMISNFRRILKKYVDMWDEGKLPITHTTMVIMQQKEEINISETLPEPLSKPSKKLKVKLTVAQLGFLFKILQEAGIIEAKKFKDIHEFISKNFTVSSKDETEDISIGKLARIWNDFDTDTAAFWDEKFVDLHNEAKKYNPNNIKKKR